MPVWASSCGVPRTGRERKTDLGYACRYSRPEAYRLSASASYLYILNGWVVAGGDGIGSAEGEQNGGGGEYTTAKCTYNAANKSHPPPRPQPANAEL